MVESFVEETIAYFGGLSNVERLDTSYVEKWRGRLPDSLLEFWLEYGIGSMADGSVWLCRPEEYDEILAVLFGSDKDFSHRDCHVIGYSAFGSLYVWSERFEQVIVTMTQSWVACSKITNPAKRTPPDRALWAMISSPSPDRLFDFADVKGKPLYKRARKKLGPLARGEVYGFFPALKLGGAAVLENLQKVSAPEHFSILAQLDTPVLWDFKPWPPVPVRPIG